MTEPATPETHQNNSSISFVALNVLSKTSTKTTESELFLAVMSRRLHSMKQFKQTLLKEKKERYLVIRAVPLFMKYAIPFDEKDISVRE